jgi:hypothetical protein
MIEKTERRAKFVPRPNAFNEIADGARERFPDASDPLVVYREGADSYQAAIAALNTLSKYVGPQRAVELLIQTTHPFLGTKPTLVFEGPPAQDPREKVEPNVENSAAIVRAGEVIVDAFNYQFFTEDGRRGRRGTNTYKVLRKEIADKWDDASVKVRDEHPDAPEIADRVSKLGSLLQDEEPHAQGVTHIETSWLRTRPGWDKKAHQLFDVLFHAKRKQVEEESDGARTIVGKPEAAMMYEGLTAYKTAVGRKDDGTTLADVAEAYVAGYVTMDPDPELPQGQPIGTLRLVKLDNDALLAAHITSIEELSAMTKADLLRIGHFMINQVKAIKNKLDKHGLPTAITEEDVAPTRRRSGQAWGRA